MHSTLRKLWRNCKRKRDTPRSREGAAERGRERERQRKRERERKKEIRREKTIERERESMRCAWHVVCGMCYVASHVLDVAQTHTHWVRLKTTRGHESLSNVHVAPQPCLNVAFSYSPGIFHVPPEKKQ